MASTPPIERSRLINPNPAVPYGRNPGPLSPPTGTPTMIDGISVNT